MNPSFAGVRVFANRRIGFAIANLPQAGESTYPVATRDGGTTWQTDGPVLHMPAAQGPLAVGQTGVLGASIYFAWCGACNSVIDVTPDAGKHWWRTLMPGEVGSVLGGSNARVGLTAIVVGPPSSSDRRAAPLWVYISNNGLRWSYRHTLGR